MKRIAPAARRAQQPVNSPQPPRLEVARAEMRALLQRKLDELPDAFRTIFVLRSVEKMSVEEAAECLGIPDATVSSRHFRARSLLRESLAREIDLVERGLFEFGGAHCDRVVAEGLSRIAKERDPSGQH